MFDFKKWLKEKNARLQGIPDRFTFEVEKYQKILFGRLLKLLDQISRDGDGNIIFNSKDLNNLALAGTITDQLKNEILNSDYVVSVHDYAQEFDKQAELNNQYFNAEFNKPNLATADEVLAVAKRGAIEAFIGEPLDSNFLLPIKSLLEDSVTSGASWIDTVTSIRDFVEGNADADGRLLQYAKGISHDEFAIADASYSNAIADEVEAEWFLWSGQDLPSSRCFCIERKDKYFHYKEIESWGNGENLGNCDIGGEWAGERDGTNKDTIFQYRGGYGCVDSIMPVSVFIVPKDVIERNIANGNYQPSDKEAELLGV